MRTEGEIKAAMDTFKHMAASVGNNPNHPDAAMVMGMCSALGWVVGEGVYNKTCETLLAEFRDHLKGKVTRGTTAQ